MKHLRRWIVMGGLLMATGTMVFIENVQAEGTGVSVGAQGGFGFANNDMGSHFTVGGTLGYRLMPTLEVAAFVNYISFGDISNDAGALNGSSQRITYFGLEGDYLLTGIVDNASIGLKVGLANSAVSGSVLGVLNVSDSTNQFLIGPKIAYDYPITSCLSVGGEANILLKTTSDDVPGYRTTYGISTLWNLLAAIKYQF